MLALVLLSYLLLLISWTFCSPNIVPERNNLNGRGEGQIQKASRNIISKGVPKLKAIYSSSDELRVREIIGMTSLTPLTYLDYFDSRVLTETETIFKKTGTDDILLVGAQRGLVHVLSMGDHQQAMIILRQERADERITITNYIEESELVKTFPAAGDTLVLILPKIHLVTIKRLLNRYILEENPRIVSKHDLVAFYEQLCEALFHLEHNIVLIRLAKANAIIEVPFRQEDRKLNIIRVESIKKMRIKRRNLLGSGLQGDNQLIAVETGKAMEFLIDASGISNSYLKRIQTVFSKKDYTIEYGVNHFELTRGEDDDLLQKYYDLFAGYHRTALLIEGGPTALQNDLQRQRNVFASYLYRELDRYFWEMGLDLPDHILDPELTRGERERKEAIGRLSQFANDYLTRLKLVYFTPEANKASYDNVGLGITVDEGLVRSSRVGSITTELVIIEHRQRHLENLYKSKFNTETVFLDGFNYLEAFKDHQRTLEDVVENLKERYWRYQSNTKFIYEAERNFFHERYLFFEDLGKKIRGLDQDKPKSFEYDMLYLCLDNASGAASLKKKINYALDAGLIPGLVTIVQLNVTLQLVLQVAYRVQICQLFKQQFGLVLISEVMIISNSHTFQSWFPLAIRYWQHSLASDNLWLDNPSLARYITAWIKDMKGIQEDTRL